MKKHYSRSEVRRVRRSINKWSKRLVIAGFTCELLFACSDPCRGLPLIYLIFGILCIVAGFVGLTFLDMTTNLYRYNYF